MKLKSLILGSVAAIGLSAGSAKAADLDSIAAFALDICDAVNVTGITISSADHCMRFSGSVEMGWGIRFDGAAEVDWAYVEWFLNFEVTGNSDWGVTRAYISLTGMNGCDDDDDGDDCEWQGDNNQDPSDSDYMSVYYDEAWISIGNATVLVFGDHDSVANFGGDTTLTFVRDHELALDLTDDLEEYTGGKVIQLTHDLGNGWSVSKGLECLWECGATLGGNYGLGAGWIGVVNYDGDTVTGHLTLLGRVIPGFDFIGAHGAIAVTVDAFMFQSAFAYYAGSGDWEWNGSVQADFDPVAVGFGVYYDTVSTDWGFIASAEFDAGDFTIGKAFQWDTTGTWDFEVKVSTDINENVSLTVGGGVDESTNFSAYAELGWEPGGGFSATKKIALEEDGDIKISGTATMEF